MYKYIQMLVHGRNRGIWSISLELQEKNWISSNISETIATWRVHRCLSKTCGKETTNRSMILESTRSLMEVSLVMVFFVAKSNEYFSVHWMFIVLSVANIAPNIAPIAPQPPLRARSRTGTRQSARSLKGHGPRPNHFSSQLDQSWTSWDVVQVLSNPSGELT